MQDHLTQTNDKPLFADVLWNRPINKRLAGKLLIAGGNLHGFNAPATAYTLAEQAGIGAVKVVLPNALQKTLGRFIDYGEYAPSTPSGSFAHSSLAVLLDHAQWADGVLLAGDIGRNSETAIVIESFVQKHDGVTTFTGDAVEHYTGFVNNLKSHNNHTLVLTTAQLQKLATACKFDQAFTSDLTLNQLTEMLLAFCNLTKITIVTTASKNIIVCDGNRVVVHSSNEQVDTKYLEIATKAAVWWLQNPTQKLESITSSLVS